MTKRNRQVFAVLATAACSMVLTACKSVPPTPDEAWASYHTSYRATGAVAERPAMPAIVEMVSSSSMEGMVKHELDQGLVELGTFEIDRGEEISYEAVVALAEKLDASAVVWNTVTTVNTFSDHPSAPLLTPGVDASQVGGLMATSPDDTIAGHTARKHTIKMFGKSKNQGVAK